MKRQWLRLAVALLYMGILGHFIFANFMSSGTRHIRLDQARLGNFQAQQAQIECSALNDCSDIGGNPLCMDASELTSGTSSDSCGFSSLPRDKGFPFATNGNYYSGKFGLIYDNENFASSFFLNSAYLMIVSLAALFAYSALRDKQTGIKQKIFS